MYFVIYWAGNTPTMGGTFPTLDLATTAFNWYQTLTGVTFVQMLTVATTSVSTWGTPPN
ncbi:MAG: hypothetical protein ACRDHZ_00775 [Ktedonobacteraceae bacterium]